MPAMETEAATIPLTSAPPSATALDAGMLKPPAELDTPKTESSSGICSGDITTSSNVFFQATMSVTLGVFIYEGTAYNVIFLARVLPAMGKEIFIPPFFVLFNLVWGLALWAYVKANKSEPGAVPKEWHDFVREVGPALPVVPSSAKWAPGKASYCRKCAIPRPERAHHCNVSGICVLRMDHYCPWINNCVGYNNYKFFLQLVIYGSLASFIGLATSLPELVLCIGKLLGIGEGDVWNSTLQTTDIVAFLMFGGLAGFLGILLMPMLFTHVPFAIRNVTAIESNYDNMANPYDLGSMVSNLESIIGEMGPDWLVPIAPIRRKGDGVSFARWDEPLGPDDRPIADEDVLNGDQLWRVRYKVRAVPQRGMQEEEFDPLKSLAQWWNGGMPDEDPYANTGGNVGCVA